MEAVTGYLTADEMEEELITLARMLEDLEFYIVRVTFGGGCDWSQVDTEEVVVSTALLPSYVDTHEELDAFQLGCNDLSFTTDDGLLQFLLCEASDIHCTTDDPELFQHFCDHWAAIYPDAYETDRKKRRTRILSSTSWKDFPKLNG